jgi:hypothetical protein
MTSFKPHHSARPYSRGGGGGGQYNSLNRFRPSSSYPRRGTMMGHQRGRGNQQFQSQNRQFRPNHQHQHQQQ